MADVTPYLDRIWGELAPFDLIGKATARDVKQRIRQILVEATDHAAANREADFELITKANEALQTEVDDLRSREQ